MKKIKQFIITNKKPLAILVIAMAVTFSGFSQEMYKVNECHSIVTKYVTAEYSETTTSLDMDGNVSTDTDYWSEPASEVYSITKVNELPEYPPMPTHDISMKREFDFDNFKFHTDASVKVLASQMKNKTQFSVGINQAGKCIAKVDSVVIVDTWYSITYSSNFI